MILGVCDSADILKSMRIIKIVINTIKIIVPIILIISGMLTFLKATADGDNKKAFDSLKRKLVAAAVIFLVPTFVGLVFKLIDQNKIYYSCLENANQEGIDNAYASLIDNYINSATESLDEYYYNSALITINEISDPVLKNQEANKLGKIKQYMDIKNEIYSLAQNYDANKAKEIHNKINAISDANIKKQLTDLLDSIGVGKPLNESPGTYLKSYNGVKYYVIIPDGATTNMPLVTYLVGGNPHAAFTNPNSAIFKNQPTASILNGSAYKYQKFIYIYVDYTADDTKSFAKIKTVMDHVISEYECDKEHIVLTGVSNGAVASFWLGYQYPNFFSAVVPMCGPAYNYYYSIPKDLSKAGSFVGTSLWTMTAGRGDFGNYEYKSQQLVKRIHEINPSSKALYCSRVEDFTRIIKSELGKSLSYTPHISSYSHCTIMEYYKVPELWEWMLKQ